MPYQWIGSDPIWIATGSGVISIMSDGVYVPSPVVGRVVRPVARLYSPAHDVLYQA
jgi:hypothetical protein